MTFGTETGATWDANPIRSHLEPGWMTIVRSSASFADCGQWSAVSDRMSDKTGASTSTYEFGLCRRWPPSRLPHTGRWFRSQDRLDGCYVLAFRFCAG